MEMMLKMNKKEIEAKKGLRREGGRERE